MDNRNNSAQEHSSDAQANNKPSNLIKDPADWTTGDEPMTAAQQSYIETLSGDKADANMTKADAARFIDEHKNQQTGDNNQGGNTNSNAIKDPSDWVTGDEEMTDAQRSYLKTLADEAGETVDENLSKADASKTIEALQQKTGRGTN